MRRRSFVSTKDSPSGLGSAACAPALSASAAAMMNVLMLPSPKTKPPTLLGRRFFTTFRALALFRQRVRSARCGRARLAGGYVRLIGGGEAHLAGGSVGKRRWRGLDRGHRTGIRAECGERLRRSGEVAERGRVRAHRGDGARV